MKGLSGVVSASWVDASDWDGGECGSKLRIGATGFLLDSSTLKMGPDRWSRNVGNKLTLLAA